MRGDGHGGQAGGREVDLQLSERLDRVGVQRNAELRRDVGQFPDRHDRADLVVGPHDGGQRDVVGVAGDRRAERVGVHPSVPVDGQPFDPRALVLGEPLHGVQDGVVLDGAGEDAGTGRVGVPAGPVQALDREVVGFGAARGEDHLTGARAERGGEGFPRLLDGAPGPPAGGVQRGRVAGDGQLGGHRLHRLREHRGGGGVVEVNHGANDSTSRRGGACRARGGSAALPASGARHLRPAHPSTPL